MIQRLLLLALALTPLVGLAGCAQREPQKTSNEWTAELVGEPSAQVRVSASPRSAEVLTHALERFASENAMTFTADQAEVPELGTQFHFGLYNDKATITGIDDLPRSAINASAVDTNRLHLLFLFYSHREEYDEEVRNLARSFASHLRSVENTTAESEESVQR